MSDFDLSGFLASFFDEARERLASINQSLVKFESGQLQEEGLVELRRDAHTIKGSALMLGVDDVGGTAHLFEDVMEQLIQKPELRNAVMLQFLFDLHDDLRQRVDDFENTEKIEVNPLREKYKELLEKQASGEIQAQAPAAEEEPAKLIGADDVKEWQDSKQLQKELESAIDETAASLVSDDSSLESLLEESVLSSDEATVTEEEDDGEFNYRPDISKIEMKAGRRHSSGRFLRVDAERLERLSNQVIELSTERARGKALESELVDTFEGLTQFYKAWKLLRSRMPSGEYDKALNHLEGEIALLVRQSRRTLEEARFERDNRTIILGDLRDQVLGLMLRPLDSVFSTFPRAVRDTATRVNKRAQLQIGGQSTEMDQGVAESLVEPLVHMLNNAIVHGIESPEERKAAGKPESGQVTIIATQSGNEIRIEVIDDGRGIDSENIKKIAIKKGVTTKAEADEMDTAEILEMIFRPGFTSHSGIDEVAGRGIGMNVVQDSLRKLTGSIRIQTEIGKGTRFVISLPVSIAVQQALLFRMGSQKFAMLAHMIEQIIPIQKDQIEKGAGGKDFVRYEKHLVPMVDLRKMLLDEATHEAVFADKPLLVIAEHIEGFVGIVVDELMDDFEVVVRDLDPYLKRYQVQGLLGTTIGPDGSVLLLIEPYGVKEMGRTAPDQDMEITALDVTERFSLRILLVEDSIIAKKIEQAMFESMGFKVSTAIDGMDALEKMQHDEFDLVVTDLEMPRLDGFGLVRRLRNEKKYEDLPILVISTRESAEDRMRAMDAGADSYLVKQQLNQERLLQTLRSLIEGLDDGPEKKGDAAAIDDSTDLEAPA